MSEVFAVKVGFIKSEALVVVKVISTQEDDVFVTLNSKQIADERLRCYGFYSMAFDSEVLLIK